LVSKKFSWRNALERAVAVSVAIAEVIAANYVWRHARTKEFAVTLVVYVFSALLLLVCAWVVFRVFVRRDYRRRGRLTSFSTFLECLIWGLYFAFPSIYDPFLWTRPGASSNHINPIVGSIGVAVIVFGAATVIVAMTWLGLSRSFGQQVNELRVSGPYRVSRNPQLVGSALLALGYVMLVPSWYALGWLGLYAPIAHMMVMTEEEHLRDRHGAAYDRYCMRVPRYLGFPRFSRDRDGT